MAWIDETISGGVWADGIVWTIGQVGITVGMAGLFIGLGNSYRAGSYTDESTLPGAWSDA